MIVASLFCRSSTDRPITRALHY